MTNNVIVLGKNYSTMLGAIRSLGEVGFLTTAYFIVSKPGDGKIVKSSKYVISCIEHVGRNNESIISELIEMFPEEGFKPLLLATDDFTASVIDSDYEKLSQYFLLPHTSEKKNGCIIRLMNKSVQSDIAKSFGFDVAKSWIVAFKDGRFILPPDISYPCFYKPLLSVEGGKDGMKKCNSSIELIRELNKIKASNRVFTVLIQEHLSIDEEFSISGMCFGKQVFLPAILRKLKVCQSHKGTTIIGIIERIDNLGSYHNKLIEMLKSLNVYGIVDIELFRCGEQYYFNEINFRTSAVCYGVVAGGSNIPGLYANAMISGLFHLSETKMNFGKTFLCEKAAWDDYIAEHMTKKELDSLYKSTNYYIIRNASDPEPEIFFKRHVSRVKKIHFLKLRYNRLFKRN